MVVKGLEPHRGVWEVFKKSGYKAYFVGGCVRDELIGRVAKDFDIATDAAPEEVRKLFVDHYDIGIKYGSVTVDYEGRYYDVTTMRRESGYSNFRHPDTLEYTDDIKLDLMRRDFTVNAMAFSFDEGHIDLFGGVVDLNKKSIRAVGDPDKRFHEDALRMMRAIRFACELGFDVEASTLKAIEKNRRGIKFISKERIYSEFKRAVASEYPDKLSYMRHTGLGGKIHKGFRNFEYRNIPNGPDLILRLAYIMKKKETVLEVLEFLRADNSTIRNVLQVMAGMESISVDSEYHVRRLISRFGEANAKRVLLIKGFSLAPYMEIIKRGDCTALADLALNGDDIISTGIAEEGLDVRHILNKLLDEVMKEPEKNKFQTLLPLAREIKKGL